jgi:hypothetical protein
MGDRDVYSILMGKQKEAPTWKTNKRWEDNIKIDLREIACEMDGTGSGSCP